MQTALGAGGTGQGRGGDAAAPPARSRSWSSGRSRGPPGPSGTPSTGRWSTWPASTGTCCVHQSGSAGRAAHRTSPTLPGRSRDARTADRATLRRLEAVLACREAHRAEREAARSRSRR